MHKNCRISYKQRVFCILGWFRQCDFITHSKDVDIGIFIKDYNPDISKRLKTSGLLPKHIFGKVGTTN